MSVSNSSRLRLVPIVLSQAFGVGCGVAGVKVNSSLVPPDVFGAYGVYLTFAPIGMWVVHAGLLKFTARHWAGAPQRPELLTALGQAWARRLPWLALAACAGSLALEISTEGRALVAFSLFASAALLAAGAIAQTALQAEGAHWKDCAVSVAGSLSRTFAPPLLFLAANGALAALWLGFTLHTLVIAALGLWALHAYWRGGDAPARSPFSRDRKSGFGFHSSIPAVPPSGSAYRGPMFITLAAAGWMLAGVNRWIVAAYFGETEAGYFTLMGGAAVVVTSALGAVFVQYFQPGFFRLGDHATVNRPRLSRRVDAVALGYAGSAIVAVVTLAFVAPWLVGPLIDPVYREAIRWVIPAGCFGVAIITPAFYQALLLAGNRERACAPVELSTAVVLVLGCVTAAIAGIDWFARWLTLTPLVPWIVTRALARRFLFRPDAVPASEPAR